MANEANDKYGEKQTSNHQFKCILLFNRYDIKDLIKLTEITDKMIGITKY